LCEFTELQVAVWSKWRRLEDDGVSSDQCRGNFTGRKMYREVPWYNTDGHTEGGISDNDLLIIIFLDDLFLDIDLD